jgi:hypothetical protein
MRQDHRKGTRVETMPSAVESKSAAEGIVIWLNYFAINIASTYVMLSSLTVGLIIIRRVRKQ